MSGRVQLSADWSYPTAIRFGAGRIVELAATCEAVGIRRPLLVTDPTLAQLPVVAAIGDRLAKAGLEAAVFSEVRPNPVESNVAAGVEAFRGGGHDGVVAIGGGSSLDVGKVVAFMSGQIRPMWDFEDVSDWWTRASTEAIAPVIAVPTTAGTGSEVGRAGVIFDPKSRRKKVIFHPRMMPVAVIADPELTLELPPVMTAGTGMDALAHCLEAYCAPSFHPMSEGIAVEGVSLVKGSLQRAFDEPLDVEARAHMMAAAMMGAVAFQRGLGAIHALSHPVGALCDTHHGLTNAVFMPYVLRFNRSAIEARIVRLGSFIGLEDPSFEGFVKWLLELRQALGVPHTLTELGVDDRQIGLLSEMAVVDPTAAGNPVSLTVEGAHSIYEAALRGET